MRSSPSLIGRYSGRHWPKLISNPSFNCCCGLRHSLPVDVMLITQLGWIRRSHPSWHGKVLLISSQSPATTSEIAHDTTERPPTRGGPSRSQGGETDGCWIGPTSGLGSDPR